MADYFDEDDDVDPFGRRPYEVGYSKPPKEHRFKKGNKAAAGRRRKQSKRIRETIFKRLNEKITVVVNGKRKRITRLDAIIQMLLQQASKSPADSLRLLTWALQHEPEFPVGGFDQKMVIEFVKRDWSDNPLPGGEEALRKSDSSKRPIRPSEK